VSSEIFFWVGDDNPAAAFRVSKVVSAARPGSSLLPISDVKLTFFRSSLSKPPSCKLNPLGLALCWCCPAARLCSSPDLRAPDVPDGENPELRIFSSAQSSCAMRASASDAGSRRVAPDVFVVANVLLEPATPCGSLFGFSLNAPPALVDSAAKESDVMGPVLSGITE
jgi:hypothetical protein